MSQFFHQLNAAWIRSEQGTQAGELDQADLAGFYLMLAENLCAVANDRTYGLVFLLNSMWDAFEQMTFEHHKLDNESRQLVIQGPRTGRKAIRYQIKRTSTGHYDWPLEEEDEDFGFWIARIRESGERMNILKARWKPAQLLDYL